MDREAWWAMGYSPWDFKESDILRDQHFPIPIGAFLKVPYKDKISKTNMFCRKQSFQEGLVKPSQMYSKAKGPLIVITMLKCSKILQPGGLATWRTFVQKYFM